MTARLNNYHLGSRIASLSKSGTTTERLTSDGLNCLELKGDSVLLQPSGQLFDISSETREFLTLGEEFDVLEISDDGRLFRCFSNKSDDNAIVITGRCNSSCIMCPDSDKARAQAVTRDIGTLLEIVRHIPSDAHHLTITGGEPFLLGMDSFLLFKALTEKFLKTDFLLLTNGRVLSVNKYCLETKRTLPPKTIIGIPLHGYDARTHDGITRTPDSFKQTVAGIQNLLRLQMLVELRIVVSKISAEYMNAISQFIINELDGVHCVKLIGLEMLGNAAKNRDEVWIPYPEAFEKCRDAISALVTHGIDVGIYNFPLCAVDRGFWPICERSISDYKVRYASGCDACAVKDACGGLFSGSRRFAECDIEPIKSRRTEPYGSACDRTPQG